MKLWLSSQSLVIIVVVISVIIIDHLCRMKNLSMEDSVVLWVKPANIITEYWDWKKYYLYSISYYKNRVGLIMQSWGENTLDVWSFQKGLLLLICYVIKYFKYLIHEKLSRMKFLFSVSLTWQIFTYPISDAFQY